MSRTVERRDEVTTIATGMRDEVVLVPGGVVWTESAEIWSVTTDAERPQRLHVTVDPHGLATDGRDLFWVGDEGNGQLALDTGEVGFLPRVGEPAVTTLAYGDQLYARGDGAFFRLDRHEADRDSSWHVQRLPIRLDPKLKVLPGVIAGRGVMYARAVEATSSGVQPRMLRVFASGKHDVLRLPTLPAPGAWAVAPAGDLLLLDRDTERLARIPRRKTRIGKWIDAPAARQVRACGPAIFILDDSGVVTSRTSPSDQVNTVAQHFTGDGRFHCGFDQLAWSPHDGSLVVVRLD